MKWVFVMIAAAAIVGHAADSNLKPSNAAEVKACGTASEPREDATWWKGFNDAQLNGIIGRALSANLNLEMAKARILEARAAAYQTKADTRPVINQQDALLSGSGAPVSTSSNLQKLLGRDSTSNGFESREAGLRLSWERDLFGKSRNLLRAAQLETNSAEEDWRATQVALLGDVATEYVGLRATQEQIALIRESIAISRDRLRLAESRFDAGLATDFDRTDVSAEILAAEAQIPALEAQIQVAAHRLAVLVGERPDQLVNELAASQPMPGEPPDIPTTLPTDLLLRRPDVRKAECELEAASARTAAVRAERFPQFSLTGRFGAHDQTFDSISLSGGGRFFSIGPSITIPVLSGGRIRAAIQAQDARQREAALELRRAVIVSLEDVEDALATRNHDIDRRHLMEQSLTLNLRKVELAKQLYEGGIGEFGPVLDASQAVISLKRQLIDIRRSMVLDVIALYRALGGGWS